MWIKDINDQFDILINQNKLSADLKAPFQKVITFFKLDNPNDLILSMHAGYNDSKSLGHEFEVILYTNKQSKGYQVILSGENAFIKIIQ